MPRILDLADGYTSNAAPDISGGSASELLSYPDDASYEVDYPSPTGGEIYYNTTLDVIRFYSSMSGWITVGQDIAAYQEPPSGIVDGINTDFDITFAAANATSLWVYKNGVNVPNSEWTFANPTLSFNTAPALGEQIFVLYLTNGVSATFTVPTGIQNSYTHTILLSEAIAKSFDLSPAPGNVSKVLVGYNGVVQVYNEDYSISGATLSVSGYNLDSLIEAGDKFTLFYFS